MNSMNQAIASLSKTVAEQNAKLKKLEEKVLYIDTVIDRTMAPPPPVQQQPQITEEKIKSLIDSAVKVALESFKVSLQHQLSQQHVQPQVYPQVQPLSQPVQPPVQPQVQPPVQQPYVPPVYDPTPPPPLQNDTLDLSSLDFNTLADSFGTNISDIQDDIVIMNNEQPKTVKKPVAKRAAKK